MASALALVSTNCLPRRGLLRPELAHASDVGVSYALLSGLGLLVHRIPSAPASGWPPPSW
jgi:hypothetical protein